MDADGRWWRDPLEELIGGRKVILAGTVAAAWTPFVPLVREFGATAVLVAATEGRGVGEQPDADVVAVEPPPAVEGTMPRMRHSLAAIADPPPELRAGLDAFDPDKDAVVLATFLNESPMLDGRPIVAHRRPEWVALEDKTRVDELLDRAGVARAPSVVVPVGEAASARRALDLGAGTVWAADASEGYHGGAQGTRWVVDDDEAAAVTAELSALARTVRVMQFLDGVATSIHGIVLPDGVATMRPVELVTLRKGHELVYSGCATFWDPPDRVRAEMKDAARRVGEVLRELVDFRGAFTLDGVATAEGFRPTELNPRFGAGFNVMTRGMPDLPVLLILDLVVAGRPLAVTAAELEQAIVDAADRQRAGGTWNMHAHLPAPLPERGARYDGATWRWAADGEPADAVAVGAGAFARASFDAARTPVGPSVGPRAAAFWDLVDAELGTSIGPLTAPPDVSGR